CAEAAVLEAGSVVERVAVGVSRGELESMIQPPFERELHGIEIRSAGTRLLSDGSENVSGERGVIGIEGVLNGAARDTARIGGACGGSGGRDGIGFIRHDQPPAQRSDITRVENGAAAQLPLYGEMEILRVRRAEVGADDVEDHREERREVYSLVAF